MVVCCCGDTAVESASAVVGQTDYGVASEVAVSIASVGGSKIVSTERHLLCKYCVHGLLTYTLNERK